MFAGLILASLLKDCDFDRTSESHQEEMRTPRDAVVVDCVVARE